MSRRIVLLNFTLLAGFFVAAGLTFRTVTAEADRAVRSEFQAREVSRLADEWKAHMGRVEATTHLLSEWILALPEEKTLSPEVLANAQRQGVNEVWSGRLKPGPAGAQAPLEITWGPVTPGFPQTVREAIEKSVQAGTVESPWIFAAENTDEVKGWYWRLSQLEGKGALVVVDFRFHLAEWEHFQVRFQESRPSVQANLRILSPRDRWTAEVLGAVALRGAALGALFLFFSFMISALLGKSVTQPMRSLSRAMDAFDPGDPASLQRVLAGEMPGVAARTGMDDEVAGVVARLGRVMDAYITERERWAEQALEQAKQLESEVENLRLERDTLRAAHRELREELLRRDSA